MRVAPPPPPSICIPSVSAALGSGNSRLTTPRAKACRIRSARAAARMAATSSALSPLSSEAGNPGVRVALRCVFGNGGAMTTARHSGHVFLRSAHRDQQLKCSTCAHGCRITAGPLLASLSALRQTEHVSSNKARAVGPNVIDMGSMGLVRLSQKGARALCKYAQHDSAAGRRQRCPQRDALRFIARHRVHMRGRRRAGAASCKAAHEDHHGRRKFTRSHGRDMCVRTGWGVAPRKHSAGRRRRALFVLMREAHHCSQERR